MYSDPDAEVRGRYATATRHAVRFLATLDGMRPERRLERLRRFNRLDLGGKLAMGAAA